MNDHRVVMCSPSDQIEGHFYRKLFLQTTLTLINSIHFDFALEVRGLQMRGPVPAKSDSKQPEVTFKFSLFFLI